MKMTDYHSELTKELEKVTGRVKELERLNYHFPKLEVGFNRYSKVPYYYDSSVNEKPTNVNFRLSCGCCHDAAHYARPYIEVDGIKIYTNPVQIYIGHYDEWNGELFNAPSWEENFEKHGIDISNIKQEIEWYIEDRMVEIDEN